MSQTSPDASSGSTAALRGTSPAAPAAAQMSPASRRRLRLDTRILTRFGVIWGLVAVIVVARIVYPGFLDWDNLRVVLTQSIPVGLVAVGMTFLVLSGAFDLSAGPTLAFGAVLYADLSNDMSLIAAAVLTLLLGIGIGVVNGLITTKLGINPFVGTLGTASIVTGAAFLATRSQPVVATKPSFTTLGTGEWFLVPICLVLFVIFVVASGFVLYFTRFGRSIYSIGGNPEASRLCGIRVDTTRVICYALVGACSVVGGMVLASQLTVVQANVGASYSLDAIAIVIIGGTSLLGGEGAMWRTAIGVLILGGISNVLNAKAVDTNWQSIMTGLVLIGAVSLDVLGRRLEARQGSRVNT